MTPYKGQTVRLNFLGTTDSSFPTTFRIDDVSIIATSTYSMPTVTTLNASSITTTSATLNGSVNPNGSATDAWFEWGTSSTLSTYNQTASHSIGSGTTSQAINASLSGLIPNTTYYFRAAASNAAGTQRGSILSFTTLSITPTPNFQSQQGYLNNTDTGVYALYSWTKAGGTGTGIKIVDIEGGWQTTHEDFPAPFTPVDGTNYSDELWRQHGTAVVGQMVAKNNGIGVTGIAYDAQYSAVSILSYSVADAINLAASKISSGDIILIELQTSGPSSGLTCECNCTQFEYIPMEYWTANYDAIRTATANGRIVVEAGGNGSMHLDSSIYGGRFNRSLYDSGAILVGAGYSTNRNPHCWTNYGNRMDVQGWGDSVVTTGYGYLFDGNGNPDRYYTNRFGGTSSASPIVAGSAAAIQGRYKNVNGGGVLSPQQMRTLLRNTGTPQGTGGSWGYKQIGPLPNIKAAMDNLSPSTPLRPTNLTARAISTTTIVLKWTDNSTDETSFKIWRKAGANAWALLTTINTANATTYSDITATGNDGTTPYSYYVRACNSSGCSPATTTAVVPYKPTALKATAGTGKVDLTWTDKSNNETGFQIRRKNGLCGQAGTWSIIHTTGANAISYSNAGLTSGNTYSYRVRSFTRSAAAPYAMGYSMWGNCVSGTVQ